MFLYYFVNVERPFEEVEPGLLRILPGLKGWAEAAYRDGERLHARIGPGKAIAKSVEMEIGAPVRGDTETWIPIKWVASGAPALFPRLEADVVVAAVGPDVTQVALRGTYQPPLGPVGRALDRVMLHRVAESSVRTFVECIADAVRQDAEAAV